MRTKRMSSVVLVAAVLSAAACGGSSGKDTASSGSSSGGSKKPIKIGVINPFSGATAPGGIATTQGYEVAVDEVNASGGINGQKVELVRGDASTPDAGISEVNRLATSEKVDLFMGTYLSGIANTASETAARNNKLYWETNALASNLTQRGLQNFIRVGADAASFGKASIDGIDKVVAPSIGKTLKGSRVCITHEQSIYGTSVADTQKSLAEKAGATVVDNVAYDPASPDLGNVILRCQKGSTDFWVSTGYVPDSNLLLRTATQQGFKPAATMMVGSADTKETANAVPEPQLTGVYVTAFAHNDANEAYAPGIKKFLDAYKAKYNADPTFPQTTVAYTGAKVLFAALAKAKSTDPAAVKKILKDIEQPLGSTPATFGVKFDDKLQNTLALPTVVQWQGGKLVTLYPEQAAPSGAKPVLQKK